MTDKYPNLHPNRYEKAPSELVKKTSVTSVTPPPGYALVKLEGAEERVAHIVEAGIDLQSGHQAIAREIIRAMTDA